MANGDTINRCNENDMYEGYHIITDDYKYIITDSSRYSAGYFKNGIPDGNWIEHYKDGSFAKGEFEVSRESFFDDSLNLNVTLTRGIGPKKGIWIFYGNDSVETKKILFELTTTKNTSTWKERFALDTGKYIETYYKKIIERPWIFGGRVIEKKHLPDGTLIYNEHDNYFRNKTKEYDSNGSIKIITRHSRIIRRSVKKEYRTGIKVRKTITRRWGKCQGCPKFH